MIQAVLWDVDDTIFDYTESDRVAVIAHFTAEGLAGDEATLATWRAAMEGAYARFLAGELSFEEQRRARARNFLGREMTDAEADEWFGRYLARFEEAWRGFDDVVPALDALPYRHGVVSNSSVYYQERKLRALGVRDRFELVLCSHEIGCAKPAAGAFLAGCEGLGLAPSEVVYVGDKLDLDAVGARDAGLHGVWLDRTGIGGDLPAGVHRIRRLDELPALVAAL